MRTAIKVAITVGLLAFLLSRMDLRQFWAVLSSADWLLVLGAGLLHLATVGPSVYRWRSILYHFQIHTPAGKLTQICLIGYFFNMFLPSAIGGDFFRAYYLARRESRSLSMTLTSTVVDRLAGLTAMLLIALAAVLAQPISVHGQPLGVIIGFLVAGFAAAIAAIFHPAMHRLLVRLLRRFGWSSLEERLELVSQGLGLLRRSRSTVFAVVSVSLVIQLAVIVAMWLIALSIGLEAPFHRFLVFIPLVNLSVAIPLTINGVGLRESMYFLLFSELGVPVETAVTLSVLNLVMVAMTALPGGLAYTLYKKDPAFPVPDLAPPERARP
ncbi:MAG: lysylphosphatidylglycerol synthase transmembrane domain-containing protein [Acidobacteriota bacterium]